MGWVAGAGVVRRQAIEAREAPTCLALELRQQVKFSTR